MTYDQTSSLVMAAVFLSYVTYIVQQFGWLPSISESYYNLPRKHQWMFTIFCWGFAIPAILAGDSVLMFVAGVGIAFVGAASSFKEKMTKTVHFSGAIVGIAASQAWIIIEYAPNKLATIPISIMILMFVFKNKIKNSHDEETYFFWIEIVAFLSILVGLGIKVFY